MLGSSIRGETPTIVSTAGVQHTLLEAVLSPGSLSKVKVLIRTIRARARSR
jgi:hypothetical protein